MCTNLSRFALVLAALTAVPVNGQPQALPGRHEVSPSNDQVESYVGSTERRIERGNALMLAAIETVTSHDTISARLRQQVNLFGHQLAGPGLYLQQGRGAARNFRLEMSIQRTQATSTISHVGDGRFLWIYENFVGQPHLKIVDLRKVRDELYSAGSPPAALLANSFAMGGLPRMLNDLQSGFQFLPVSETYLGDVPVHELRGVWRPEPLARLLPNQAQEIRGGRSVRLDELPAQAPHEIVIFLGKAGHFPHRIEYHQLSKEAAGPRTTPVVILELFEVRLNGQIDEHQFGKPADLPESDYTRRFLEQLGMNQTD